jgi:NADH-quinone oxidoreductase subunit G
VVFPAESYAEKEGTVTHPDGRLQRLRPGTPSPGSVRPIWEVLAELSALLGDETEIESAPDALGAIASEVPFYAGMTHEEIGGTGVRWQDREAAPRFPAPGGEDRRTPRLWSAPGERQTVVGTYRDLWAAEVTDRSPALRFLAPKQAVELAPADAARLDLGSGDEVDVRSNGTSVRARISIHERVKPGTGFLIEGLGDGAGTLRGELVEITKPGAPE